MNKLNYFLLSLLLLTTITAQTITFNEDSSVAAIKNDRLYFPLGNNGVLAGEFSSLEKKFATYDEEPIFFFSGFFLSGYSDTTLWANKTGELYPANGDYEAGNIGTESEDPGNIIYTVRESDTPFGKEWLSWKKAVGQGAYFYDGDNDGIYNPVDKNNNGRWDENEDKPDILYDATLFTVYNDGTPANERWWGVGPLGIELRQTVFVSNRNRTLNDVVFVRYSIFYKGLNKPFEADSLTEVIFSIYSDCDLDSPFDDLSGCDTLLESGYTYNDSTDENFGVNSPAIFKTIVQGPLIKSSDPVDIGYNKMGPNLGEQVFTGYKNGRMNSFIAFLGGFVPTDLPSNKIEARNYMNGLIRNGDQVDPCDWYFSEVMGGVDCSVVDPFFWYSGDPVTDYGWINNRPEDQRDLTSTGKFTLHKNEPMDIIVAYIVGRGTDALNSITVARETVQYVHEEYGRNFSTIVGVKEEEKEKMPSLFTLYQNYPNPFNPSTTIKLNIANGVGQSSHTTLKIYDVLGREIETLLNQELAPGVYELEFNASNLPSGVYFYRLNAGEFSESKKMILMK